MKTVPVTLPTEAQDIFNRAALHLLTQGEKSEDADACMYRGPDGLMCALGALIPNELYTPALEGKSPSQIAAISDFGAWKPHFKLLYALQYTHDEEPPAKWADELRAVAERFNLSTAVLDGVSS